jgi:hypothetical protein
VAFLPGHVWGAAPLSENVPHTTRFFPSKNLAPKGVGVKNSCGLEGRFPQKGLSQFFSGLSKTFASRQAGLGTKYTKLFAAQGCYSFFIAESMFAALNPGATPKLHTYREHR